VPSLASEDTNDVPAIKRAWIVGEQRDTERAVTLWHNKASATGGPPPITAFDLSRLTGDWGHRFLISTDKIVEDSVFLIYGSPFARLLELPETPLSFTPMVEQLPERYRPLFGEGCVEAITEAAPARFSGAVVHHGKIEFYRAVFMPCKLNASSWRPLIFGSFNYRVAPRVSASAALRRMAGWPAERSASDEPADDSN
jgi:hypothetical protein